MTIPNSFTQAISNAFYDKTITVYVETVETDSEGMAIKTAVPSEVTFMGNVQFDNLAQLQEDYGLREAINIAISCAVDTDIAVGKVIEYAGVTYMVTECIPSDSNKLVVGKKWLLKSSTLISA